MAQNHPLSTPFGSTGDGDQLESALTTRVALAYLSASDVQALDLTGIDTPAISVGRNTFAYDSTDTTTAHDGSTCLVTADGKRFKNDGTFVGGTNIYAVDDRDTTSPPASPASGDSYLLPAAPTGDWASYAKHIARYRDGNWQYVAPRAGMLAYLDDEAAYAHYDGSVWQDGLGALTVGAGSVKADRLEQAYGWRVESETATAPASIPGAGTLYIVGASASGVWAGEDGAIARSNGSAWEFVTAAEGMTVFDKSRGFNVSYKSGVWQLDQPATLLLHAGRRVTNGATVNISTLADYVTVLDLGSHSVASANNIIRVRGCISVQMTGLVIGLFFDSETTPRQTFSPRGAGGESYPDVPFELEYVVPDTASRNVYIKCEALTTNALVSAGDAYGFLEELGAN
ncbi:MAG: DUF2793 domain-containing protein [Devosiaceae bacterium]|nr:DUF2793 domain-containing protein [Devosiaceae bacterium MH13]